MENSRSSCKHVVLIPSQALGHCVPFLNLAPRLTTLGVKVTFLCFEYLVLEFHDSPKFKPHIGALFGNPNIDFVTVHDGFSIRGATGWVESLRQGNTELIIGSFAPHLAALMAKSPAPCCIVSDMLVGWSQELAAKFGIERVVLHTQSAANLALMLHVPTLIAEGRLPLTDASNLEDLIFIPGLKVPLQTSDLPSDLRRGSMLRKLYNFDTYDLFMRISRKAAEAPVVLINTFVELEGDVFDALDDLHGRAADVQMPKTIAVGPLLPPSMFSKDDTNITPDHDTSTAAGSDQVEENDLDESIVQFLDTQPRESVVYIAFGSFGNNDVESYAAEMALGLEASLQPFLWVESSNHLRPDRAHALRQILPPGFEERTKERGKVVIEWAPQRRILRHPAVGAFLSHCGWNSILEGIAAGLPILTWPQRAEQHMNARFLVDVAKLGIEFKWGPKGKVTRMEVERMVRMVMQQEEGQVLRSNAASLKQTAAKNASSDDGLKKFLALCEQFQPKCCT